MYKLLTVGADAKTVKGEKYGYLTGILYLKPSTLLCPACSEGCRKSCLFSAGRGRMSSTIGARMRRTGIWHNQKELFKRWLDEDVGALVKEAGRKGLRPCVRLNGTSDINVEYEFKELLEKYNTVQFYDYTKVWGRTPKFENYYLVYSRSENTSLEDIDKKIKMGYNVAVVFKEIPETWEGWEVIKGDDSDLRFLDPQGVIVGLTAKGKAKHDSTGFVIGTN